MTASEGVGRGPGRRGPGWRRGQLARELRRLVVEQGPGMWAARGACRGLDDPDVMFPAAEPGSGAYAAQVAAAKRVCAGCPVRAECLSYAVSALEVGVWGGLDDEERRALRRHRRRECGDEEAA